MTGCVVHYSDGDTDRNKSVAAYINRYSITDLTGGDTYIVSVEATSKHISGVSHEKNITLGRPTE